MKGDHQVVAAVVIFFAGAAFGGLVEGRLISALFKDYVPALVTLLAAYIGASYAFKLQSDKEDRENQQGNIVAGNLAIFNILRKLNILINYQRQIITPIRGKRTAFLEMQPTLHLLEEDIRLDLNSLSFLLNSDNPDLLGELSVEESKFQSALDAINKRSKIHLKQVQPKMERASVVEGDDYTFQQIEQILGQRLYVTIHKATDQVIDHVDSAVSSLQEVGEKLANTMKELYPNENIISLAVIESSTQ